MSPEFGFGGVHLGVSPVESARELGPETPFQLAVLGDFSGRGNRRLLRDNSQLAALRPQAIDRDDFGELLQRLEPRLDQLLQGPDGRDVALTFRQLDDFHPDAIFQRGELFADLRQLRDQLYNPHTFEQAAHQVRSWMGTAEPGSAEAETDGPGDRASDNSVETTTPPVDTGQLLDQMLEAPVQPAPSDPWDSWIKQLVAPYVSPAADPRQAELVRCVDVAIAATMNRLLHHPDFQRLEAAWRSLDWLVRNVETSPTLRLFILDLSIDELHQCIAAANDPLQSAVAGWLTSSARLPAGVPYALLVSPFSFGGGDPDRQALTALSALAQASSTAIIATAATDLVGFQPPDPGLELSRPVADSWQQLCQVPGSAGVGLIWPRYMVRLPYGPDTSPLERFEMTEEISDHDDYVWGSGAMLAAGLIARSFCEQGWQMQPGRFQRVSGLPLHLRPVDGSIEAHPCGEILVDATAARHLRQRGITPLLSVRDQDGIEVRDLQGLSGLPLRGPWTERP